MMDLNRTDFVGWVERGHDIAAPAVSFIPRDTHHLSRVETVDGYRPSDLA